MVVRNCMKLLSELSEIEQLIKEHQQKLNEAGLDIDLEEILSKHIQNQLNSRKNS